MAIKLDGLYEGRVIKYDVERGFGFIRVVNSRINEDAFIHFKDIEPTQSGFKKLVPEDVVTFELHRGEKGLSAKNLVLSVPREVQHEQN